MDTAQPLNLGLFRLHRVFYVIFGVGATIFLVGGITSLIKGKSGNVMTVLFFVYLAFAAAHWYAAKGAKYGKRYGRVISRIIGALWLIGFPLGTLLGTFALKQAGKRWRPGGEQPSLPESQQTAVKPL